VRDAAAAYRHVVDAGAWAVPTHVEVMELNIPAIHGVGESLIYFVDRYDEFSIFDIDFRTIPGAKPPAPPTEGLHFFGIVQYIGAGRTSDWSEFYSRLFGFTPLPERVRFGILPKGLLLESPCCSFYLQLIEPEPAAVDVEWEEHLQRIGLGAPDIPAAVRELERHGVEFIASETVHASERGALTKSYLGSVMFELVHSEPPEHKPK